VLVAGLVLADLQRDLGGAIMQSILGALLTAGYATAFGKAIAGAPNSSQITDSVHAQLTKSFSSAENTAEQYPQYAKQITETAKSSFVDGANWAYLAGIIAVVLGAVLVFFLFPKKKREEELLAEYQEQDAAAPTEEPAFAAADSSRAGDAEDGPRGFP
jgi:MFS transporter, DHA2 family, multidrug resistance protein